MNINLDDVMTPEQHLAALEHPHPARDSGAERHVAVQAEIDDFVWNDAETNGQWRVLLPAFLPEVRSLAERVLEDYRVTYASDPSDELNYGATISSDYAALTVAPSSCPDPVAAVPVGLFRSRVGGRSTLERHYAFGSRTLADIADDAQDAAQTERGCDLRMMRPAGLHDSLTRRSARFVWPIAFGEHLVFLRYCSECIGALFAKYEIGQSDVSEPFGIG